MKKVLALFLAVLMVTSCMMLTAFAAEESATYTGTKFVAVSDCDTVEGWVDSRNMALSTEIKTQGTGSITSTMTGTSNEVSKLGFEFHSPVAYDLTNMKTLVFDLYISDVDAIDGVYWEFELRGVGGSDKNEAAARTTLQAICGQDLKDGWNRVTLPLSTLFVTGTVDWTNWNFFRMYSNEGSNVTYGCEGDTVMAIDNMYFTAENIDNYHIVRLNAPAVNVAHNGATAEKAGLHITDNIPDWEQLHHYNYGRFEFDIEISDAAANDYPYTVAFGFQQGLAQPGYTYTFTPSEVVGEDLVPGVRYHVVVPARKWATTGFNASVSELRNFQVYNAGNGPAGTDATVSFSGFFFSNNTVVKDLPAIVENAKVLISQDGLGESTWDVVKHVGWGAALFKGVGDDFSGVTTQFGQVGEYSTGTSVIIANDNNGTANGLSADNYFKVAVEPTATRVNPEWLTNSQVVRMQLDVYVEATNLKKSGEAIDVDDLDIGVSFGGSNTSGLFSNGGLMKVLDLNSAENIGDGWYRVVYTLAESTNYPAIDLKDLTYLGFYGNVEANYGVTYDSLLIAVDNICAVFPAEDEFQPTTPDRPVTSIWNELTANKSGESKAHNATTALKTGLHFSFNADSVDTTQYNAFSFDILITDVAANDIVYQICLRNSGASWNGWNNNAVEGTLRDLAGYELVAGWNHVDIDLSRFGKAPSKVFANVAPQGDDTRWNAIVEIKMANVGGGTNTTDATVTLSNIGFHNAVFPVPDRPVTSIWNELDSANRKSAVSLVHNATTAMKTGLHVSLNADNVDTTPYNAFSFDVLITDVAANDIIYQIAMTGMTEDGTMKQSWNGWNNSAVEGTLRDLAGYELSVGLNHVDIDLSRFGKASKVFTSVGTVAPQGGANMANIVEIKMANVGGGTNTTDATVTLSNICFCVSDFSIPEEPETPETPDTPEVPEATACVDIHGANLVLNQNFKLNFNADLGGVVDAYMTIAFNGNTVMKTGVAGATDENGNTRYVYSYDGIYAHQMAKPITAKLWALGEDGLLITDVKADYSVKENLKNLIENENSTAATKTLATDALIYGAAAQTYANIILPELITNGVDLSNASTTAFGATQLATVVNGEYTAQAAQWTGATLVLDNTINVRFFLKAADVSALNVTVSGVAAAGTVTEFTLYDEEEGVYYFDVPVLATEYNNTIKVVADDANYFVNYSVNHYLAKKYEATPADSFNSLLLAIYRYGVSAAAY